MAPEELHAFTARLPPEAYDALKSLAALSERTLSAVLADAVMAYLVQQAQEEHFDAMLQRTRARFQKTIERLSDST